jgi:hypothetical protein
MHRRRNFAEGSTEQPGASGTTADSVKKMLRLMKRACWFLIAAGVCLGQGSFCGLADRDQAVSFLPSSAQEIIADLADIASFDPRSFHLLGVRDAELKTRVAAAQVCNVRERYIFYDPDSMEEIRTKGAGSYWPKYFVFAHEVAHHVNNDALEKREGEGDGAPELKADRSAARWLTRRGATVQELVTAINTFVKNERDLPGYPSRCKRVAGVIDAYADEAKKINADGGNKPLYRVGNCAPVLVRAATNTTITVPPPPDPAEPVPQMSPGIHARRRIEAKVEIRAEDVVKIGAPAANANFPADFTRDVSGMCAVTMLKAGDQLTWDNIGVCALMK